VVALQDAERVRDFQTCGTRIRFVTRSRRALGVILAVAALHAALYIAHERPEWSIAWTDQGGYRLLAEGLRQTGSFTRFPGVSPFVPEAIRTPGYPLFVAVVFAAFGDSQLAVAIAQALLFLVICVLVYAIARRCAPEPVAIGAAAVTACYSPLPFFGALLLTELWTTFVLTVASFCLLRALHARPGLWGSAAGFCYAYTALSRPAFALLPVFLGVSALLLAPRTVTKHVPAWGSLAVVFALTMTPWFVYTHRHFGVVTLSPAGGVGRAVWEGSWQGRWPGRVQSQLTRVADTPIDDATLDEAVQGIARRESRPVEPMLSYVHQWRDIRAIWVTPTVPRERVDARVRADAEYLRQGLENIRQTPLSYLQRRLVPGVIILWAAEIPLRQEIVERLPTWGIRLIWLPQALLAVLAVAGSYVLYRAGRFDALIALAAPVVYVTAVHFFFLTEARQSLPAKPGLIVLAAIGTSGCWFKRVQGVQGVHGVEPLEPLEPPGHIPQSSATRPSARR
jgi:hypothetical protein